MPAKMTLIFQDNDAGWSETYYLAEEVEVKWDQMLDVMTNARRAILGVGAKITGSRISSTVTPKKTRINKLDIKGQATYLASVANPTALTPTS